MAPFSVFKTIPIIKVTNVFRSQCRLYLSIEMHVPRAKVYENLQVDNSLFSQSHHSACYNRCMQGK